MCLACLAVSLRADEQGVLGLSRTNQIHFRGQRKESVMCLSACVAVVGKKGLFQEKLTRFFGQVFIRLVFDILANSFRSLYSRRLGTGTRVEQSSLLRTDFH